MPRPHRPRSGSVHPVPAVLAAALVLAVWAAAPADAQERFGAAVAVTGAGEVAVLKPGALRGPAEALVFRADGSGGWSRAARLPALTGAFPGEGLTPSLAAGGDLLLMGGGDPDGAVAGHLYARGGEGWSPVGRVPADPAVEPAAGLPATGLDMATLMRLMEPPARTVALSPDGALLAVAGGGVEAGTVHLLRRLTAGPGGEAGPGGGPAGWVLEAAVRADGEAGGARDTRFGAAMALDGDLLLVGAPAAGAGGGAWIFERVDGAWRQAAVLASDSAEAGMRLGAAVALAEGEALVGAPGRDRVVRFAPGPDGVWRRAGTLGPEATAGPEADDAGRVAGAAGVGGVGADAAREEGARTGSTGFGTALAVSGDRLLVGAPGAEDGRGVVHAFVRQRDGWTPEARLAPRDRRPGDAFGAALALGPREAVVGAPGGDGGRGRAAVVVLEGAGAREARDAGDAGNPAGGDRAPGAAPAGAPWGALTWLDPELELEAVMGGEVRCEEGEAEGFACQGVDLLSFLPLSAMGAGPGEQVSDVWGWADPETGREYALVGRTAGLAFVDVTDATRPRFVGLMAANPSHARDIKVYRDHAFLTGDGAGDHGLLVFDLTRLREPGQGGGGRAGSAGDSRDPGDSGDPGGTAPGRAFEPDARYDLVASAHNLVIDTESGFAYTVGTNTGGQSCGGGLHMIDIRDPLEPTFAGCYTDTEGLIWSGRTHDAQCTVYRGPDEAYRGRQLCFAANETALRIVDVTDKEAPVPVASASHPGTAYVHQGWLTEDHRYFYVNDELDEIVGTTDRTRTLVWDIQELEDPILVAEHRGPDQATDHNLFIRGDRAYLANYQAGFRVLDISDPESPVEIGWFDTTPYGANPPGFLGGAWTAWPFFESGTVVVTSMNEGLFLLRPRPAVLP